MSTATHTKAHLYACPDGHAGQQGTALRTIVPDGLDLAPACTACRQPMTPAGGPLRGNWRVDDCCTPAGPGGRWAGPPRDPAVCVRCFGTRRAVICTTCLLPGCLGDHGDTCLACDGTGRLDCASCEGEGHRYNQFNEDEGLCPDPGCVAGRVTCETCGGTGAVSADRPAERAGNQGLWREFPSRRAGRNRERPPARSLAVIRPIPEVTAADRPGRIRLGRRPVILPGPLDALALQLMATRRGHRVLLNGNRTVVLGLETLPGIPSARRVSLRLSNGRFR